MSIGVVYIKSEGFDIEGIVGPVGNVMSGQMVSFDCEGLNSRNCPLGWKVKCYGKLGLHRYNLIKGTNLELHSLFKFNKWGSGASSFFITLAASHDAFSLPCMQTFQVRVDEQQYACLNVSFVLLPGLAAVTPPHGQHQLSQTVQCVENCLLGLHMLMISNGFTWWINQSYLAPTGFVCTSSLFFVIKFGKLPEGKLEFVKVAIETDEETPLKAKSSVLYIAFKGLAVDGADESVEQRAIIKSEFNELTGCLAVKDELCKGEDYVAPTSVFERRLAYHLSRVRA
ncbi:UPF0725 protein [Raphanus sativus]|uniref:UPF0725 protein At1g02770-like n=1 Tax=Raphanus sativus TaxID=3726 RepID=A0A9W3DIB8_RAPSA|nr:UPF0725 protein At1g02770-like [Raphanus sativus]KAJ4900642.1 UPF0725 protein [Raphanus sativus]